MRKWFWATVAVGLVPMLLRLILCSLLIERNTLQLFAISDIIVWGLVLNISIFNERGGLFNYKPEISSVSSTISVIFIVIFSLLFIFELINEAHFIFRSTGLLLFGILFAIASLLTCLFYIDGSKPHQERLNINREEVH
ncbi:MAG: hypothetical protein FWD40_05675 [Treponema sp.]|nr:hypothetical protein [Treponema sp.]